MKPSLKEVIKEPKETIKVILKDMKTGKVELINLGRKS